MDEKTLYNLGEYQILKVDEVSDFGFFLVNPNSDGSNFGIRYTDDDFDLEPEDFSAETDGEAKTNFEPTSEFNSESAANINEAQSSAGKSQFRRPKRSDDEPETDANGKRIKPKPPSDRILLPTRLALRKPKPGDLIRVFVYKDNEERLTATMQEPLITLGEIGLLKVRNVDERGAWMQWGLDKDLFVPYREQVEKMEADQSYLVYLYLDEQSDRLAATARLEKVLRNEEITVEEGEKVNLLIWQCTDLGYKVAINNKHKGLVYHNDVFQPVKIGDRLDGYIGLIREDLQIDVTLRPIGYRKIEPNAEKILDTLKENDGFLDLHDKSDPGDITARLHMSKKTFKQAIGKLYKEGIITLESDGIRLVEVEK
ncbi:MAG: hypothetical protein LAT57_05930 [Balneolales bacterium]|nr:hypothetical protein [Balneolales bacterium]